MQENSLQMTLLNGMMIETQDHNEITAESESPQSLFREMVGDVKTQI